MFFFILASDDTARQAFAGGRGRGPLFVARGGGAISAIYALWTLYARSVVMSRIESRLRERDEARKAAMAARRLEKEKESRVEETPEFFSQQFSSQVKGMHERGRGGWNHVEYSVYSHRGSPRSSQDCSRDGAAGPFRLHLRQLPPAPQTGG